MEAPHEIEAGLLLGWPRRRDREYLHGGANMKKKDVVIGERYAVKVSGFIATVRVIGESPYGGWIGCNETTGRKIRIRSAARLRFPIAQRLSLGLS